MSEFVFVIRINSVRRRFKKYYIIWKEGSLASLNFLFNFIKMTKNCQRPGQVKTTFHSPVAIGLIDNVGRNIFRIYILANATRVPFV